MPTLLHLDSSSRGAASISRDLTRAFAEAWKVAHPDGEIITRDLLATPVPYVDEKWVAGAFSLLPATAEQRQALAVSDELIAELKAADHYVFGVPMYNFGIPAVFKAYIDQITRLGKTVLLAPGNISVGLLRGKKATVVLACGGTYGPESVLAPCNFVEPYLRTIFGFLGVKDITFFTADHASDVTFGKIDAESYLQPLREQIRLHARQHF